MAALAALGVVLVGLVVLAAPAPAVASAVAPAAAAIPVPVPAAAPSVRVRLAEEPGPVGRCLLGLGYRGVAGGGDEALVVLADDLRACGGSGSLFRV